MKTGFKELDKIIDIDGGKLIVVGARPAMGKSLLGLNIITNLARQKIPTLVFNLEMSKEQVTNNIVAIESELSRKDIGKDESYNEYLKKSAKQIEQNLLHIDDTPGISIQEIREKCMNVGARFVLIDYIQLVSYKHEGISLSRKEELEAIGKELKELAKELNIIILVSSQLSCSVEEREDKVPKLDDFSETRNFVKNADIVMLSYRESCYKDLGEVPDIMDVIVTKNLDEKLAKIKLKCYFSKYLITD